MQHRRLSSAQVTGRPRGTPGLVFLVALILCCVHCGSDSGSGSDSGTGGRAGAGGAPDAGIDGSTGGSGGTMDAGTDGGDAATPEGCGDGILQAGEVCDDGNGASGDGCSADCTVIEQNFACPTPGEACVSTVECGDGRITGNETCDDNNTEAGDGCDAQCAIEDGYTCAVMGAACRATECGDGIVAGFETCDDGDSEGGDGCSAECQLERGFKCDVAGQGCEPVTCGDSMVEGAEACDDGNLDTGDGCSPLCDFEPVCEDGTCQARCGDGIKLNDEGCDDGNQRDGDGCSSSCEVEPGFTCQEVVETPALPAVYRDFVGTDGTGSDDPVAGNWGPLHLDFQKYNGCREDVEDTLDGEGKPVLLNDNNCIESSASFAQWYRSDPDVNRSVVGELVLDPVSGNPDAFEFFSTVFYPLTGLGWNDASNPCTDEADNDVLCEQTRDDHNGDPQNFHFTSEVRYWFTYRGGERLTFDGDDDVWVFINDHLAVDIAGVHGNRQRWILLPDPNDVDGDSVTAGDTGGDANTSGVFDPAVLGISLGGIYEVAVYQAERHTERSQYRLTLENFLSARSTCDWICGDGVATRFEACDDGVNDGSYGGCTETCELAPFCGDGIVQADEEQCDDGVNLTTYDTTGSGACAPGCVTSSYCGDGNLDSMFGEECDNGTNAGDFGGCNPDCTLAERCGDGVVQEQEGEQCDDGNLISFDGCSDECKLEGPS